MKKIIFVLIILTVFGFIYCSGTVPYYKKCTGCQTEYSKKHGLTLPANAWRDFSIPIKEIDGKKYATYKCCYGHKMLVEL